MLRYCICCGAQSVLGFCVRACWVQWHCMVMCDLGSLTLWIVHCFTWRVETVPKTGASVSHCDAVNMHQPDCCCMLVCSHSPMLQYPAMAGRPHLWLHAWWLIKEWGNYRLLGGYCGGVAYRFAATLLTISIQHPS
jgi:hypothetical protein